ncbi:MAG: FxLYD domain-containing protein [Caldilineaceae bacterium]
MRSWYAPWLLFDTPRLISLRRGTICRWCGKPLITLLLTLSILLVTACGGDDEARTDTAPPSATETVTVQGPLPWQQVGEAATKVLSANTFPTGSGRYVYLVGELENTSEETFGVLTIKIMGYNRQGEVFETEETQALLQQVAPGAKAPFSMAMDGREIERYEIEVTGAALEQAPTYQLAVVNATQTEPKSGYVWYEGEISNTGAVGVDHVRVIAVLYDPEGKVVEATNQDLDGQLAPGATSAFKFIANHRGAASYQLLVTAAEVP